MLNCPTSPAAAATAAVCSPTYWSNYNTRFLSPDVVMLDQASQPPQHRLLQQQPNVQQLLARLPGIQQRQAQLAGQQPPAPAVGKRLPPRVAAVLQNAPLSPEDVPERHPLEEQMKVWDELWDPPPEPLDEWDLRAVMEKRRRKEREWSGACLLGSSLPALGAGCRGLRWAGLNPLA